jgi:hypothetical protein
MLDILGAATVRERGCNARNDVDTPLTDVRGSERPFPA